MHFAIELKWIRSKVSWWSVRSDDIEECEEITAVTLGLPADGIKIFRVQAWH